MSILDWLIHPKDGRVDSGRIAPLQIPVSGYAKQVYQAGINDESELRGVTKTAVAQAALTQHLIGVDGEEGEIIEAVLYDSLEDRPCNYPDTKGLRRGLASFFDYCYVWDLSGERADAQGLPVVKAMLEVCNARSIRLHQRIENDDPRYNLEGYYMPTLASNVREGGGSLSVGLVDGAFPESEDRPRATRLLTFIVENWDICKDREPRVLWKTLAYLSLALEPWQEEAIDRRCIFDSLRDARASRLRLDEAERRREAECQRKADLIRYPLANGDFVLAPLGWTPVNHALSTSCKYAGVFTLPRANGENPTLLFFCQKPVNELSDAEVVELLLAAESILADSSLTQMRREGRIGVFPIAEAGETLFGDPPGGAEIFRNDK